MRLTRILALALLTVTVGCEDMLTVDAPAPAEPNLDVPLRQAIAEGGVVPLPPVAPQADAVVDLGRSLFFDKILSGNRDVSCATCHDPSTHLTDGLSLSIGAGGVGFGSVRTVGDGRQFVPRNSPSLFNQGLGLAFLFWDGRVSALAGAGNFATPNRVALPTSLNSVLAAQAMLPVLNRIEMRGVVGDLDQAGRPNELAAIADTAPAEIWAATMRRLLAIQEYKAKFRAAYATIPEEALGFEHAATALAAFQIDAFTRTNSPFDQYIAGNSQALSSLEKRGALLFFRGARCAACHRGRLLGGGSFANVGVPQIGPGVGARKPLDLGRGEDVPDLPPIRFTFRIPPLRNVELTAPYMHSGAYPTLDAVVRHYNNADSAQRNFDPSHLAPAVRAMYHGDAATVNAVLESLDGRLRPPIGLTIAEQADLVAFLKTLTDPAARDLRSVVPASVPSGLAIRD